MFYLNNNNSYILLEYVYIKLDVSSTRMSNLQTYLLLDRNHLRCPTCKKWPLIFFQTLLRNGCSQTTFHDFQFWEWTSGVLLKIGKVYVIWRVMYWVGKFFVNHNYGILMNLNYYNYFNLMIMVKLTLYI